MVSMRNRVIQTIKNVFAPSHKHITQIHSPAFLHQHLKLDRNSSSLDAYQQITNRVEKFIETGHSPHNVVVASDITCHPDLIGGEFTEHLAKSILISLDQEFPGLRDRFVGISDDENRLPLHGLMRTGALAWEDIDNIHLFIYE